MYINYDDGNVNDDGDAAGNNNNENDYHDGSDNDAGDGDDDGDDLVCCPEIEQGEKLSRYSTAVGHPHLVNHLKAFKHRPGSFESI